MPESRSPDGREEKTRPTQINERATGIEVVAEDVDNGDLGALANEEQRSKTELKLIRTLSRIIDDDEEDE